MKLIHLAAAFALAYPFVASAQDVLGAGGMTCAKYTNQKTVFDKPTILVVTSWTQGFITATNAARLSNKSTALRYVDQEQIETYTRKYCTEHPLKSVVEASVALVAELASGH